MRPSQLARQYKLASTTRPCLKTSDTLDIPSESWIRSLYGVLPTLIESQEKDFISNAEELMLQIDAGV